MVRGGTVALLAVGAPPGATARRTGAGGAHPGSAGTSIVGDRPPTT